MLLSLRKTGLTSLFKEARVFKVQSVRRLECQPLRLFVWLMILPKLDFSDFKMHFWGFGVPGLCSGFLKRALAQTCLRAWYQVRFFWQYFWAFLGPCVRGRGRPWYGTSAQPESHFTCSSPRGAPRVVPSASLLNYFWAFLGALGRGEGAPLVRHLCKTQKSLHGRHVWETLSSVAGPGDCKTNPSFALFSGKFVWTNGPESSSKVSPVTGIGPWMALPSKEEVKTEWGTSTEATRPRHASTGPSVTSPTQPQVRYRLHRVKRDTESCREDSEGPANPDATNPRTTNPPREIESPQEEM